jgi:hypothetical protein
MRGNCCWLSAEPAFLFTSEPEATPHFKAVASGSAVDHQINNLTQSLVVQENTTSSVF